VFITRLDGKQAFTTNGDADEFRNYTIKHRQPGYGSRTISRAREDSGWQRGDEESGEGVGENLIF
jgi:hypothetical protein